MRAFIILFASLLISLVNWAADRKYAVKDIPEALLKKANVVKRYEEVYFEVVSLTETVLRKKYALTILNENGERYAQLAEYYDKLRQVKSIDGALYDADGNLLKKVKGKDIQDIKGDDGMSLVDDSRYKIHEFHHRVYPYTVEYEIEIKHNHTFYLEPWMPQEGEHFAVQESKYTVVYPETYTIRYRSMNYKGEPVAATEKNKKVLTWKVEGLTGFSRPFAAPVWNELTTVVYLAPTEFEIQGYKGNMSTWEDMGKFQVALNKGRDKLPEQVVQQVHQLTAGVKEEKEKVKILYSYLQKNTRYISIQLGIGGWQPFEAAFVAQKGYGDCKALSNYMYSLLKVAGIKSHYAIIRAGNTKEDRRILEDFPFKQSNHVILCVPLQKDTMWLECTSQTTPAGYMGSFTGNRKALLVDENGGKLVSTPSYKKDDNLQVRTIKGTIDENGDLLAVVNTKYTGIQQDGLQGAIHYLSKDKLKERLNEELSLSTYEINDFKYEEKKEVLPQVNEQLNLTVSKFATITGKRLFITPNLLNQSTIRLSEEERKYDYVFDVEYRDADSIEITIPDGYTPESLPQDVSLKTPFGSYSYSVKVNGNKLVGVRVYEQFSGRFPAKDKEDIARFYAAVFKADRSKVVLVKKENQ